MYIFRMGVLMFNGELEKRLAATLVWMLGVQSANRLPNRLTQWRLGSAALLLVASVSIFLEFNFFRDLRWVMAYACLSVFIVGWITDGLDGFFARILNAESEWGKKWDPKADKLLMASYALTLASEWESGNPVWSWGMWAEYALFFIMFTRELIIERLRLRRGHDSFPVVFSGKGKTTAQGVAFIIYGILLISPVHLSVGLLALASLLVATILAVYSAIEVWQNGKKISTV